MKLNTNVLLILVIALSGCASQAPIKEKPDWVNGSSHQYPTELFLTGQGASKNLYDAKNLARADLVKSFEVTVKESSHDTQLFERKTEKNESVSHFDEKVFRSLITQTSRSIEGVEIVDTYLDPTTHQRYALAVLSKQKAKEQFRQKVEALDKATQTQIDKANSENNLLKKAAAAHQAILLQQKRIAHQTSLQVVDASGRGIPPKWSLPQLRDNLDELLSRIHILPDYAASTPGDVKKVTTAAIAQSGFSLGDINQADYILKVSVLLDAPIQERGWIWMRGSLEIQLINTNNEVIGVKRWPLKTSSTSTERAKARMSDEISKVLLAQLRDVILDFSQ